MAAVNQLLSPAVARMVGRFKTLRPAACDREEDGDVDAEDADMCTEEVPKGAKPPLVADTVQGNAPPGRGEKFLVGATKKARGDAPFAAMLGSGLASDNLARFSGGALPPIHLIYPDGPTPEQRASYDAMVAANKAFWERSRAEFAAERARADPGAVAHRTTTGSGLYVGSSASTARPAPRTYEREQKEMSAGGGPLPMLLPTGSQQALEAAGPKTMPPPNGIVMYDVNRAQYAAAPLTGKQAKHSVLAAGSQAARSAFG